MEKEILQDQLKKINSIKIMNQSTGRSRGDIFYVVTRSGRRAWPKNYWTLGEAQFHAESLINALKSFKDPNWKNVLVVETKNPDSIN